MANSSLLKSPLHNSIAQALFNEIVTRQTRYYYFLGRTLTWEDELTPPFPTDSIQYELNTRNEIITMKEITSTDVATVIPRYDWQSGFAYDQYDTEYCEEVIGINLVNSGFGYGAAPYVYIGDVGAQTWIASAVFTKGMMLKVNGRHYIVTVSGTTGETAPTHTEGNVLNGTLYLEYVSINNGNGTGATATATILDGDVIDITLTHRGTGYTATPTVIIAGGDGEGAVAHAVIGMATSGVQRLEDSKFYVITDEFNVYKCLDNNNGAISTYKPIGTTVDPVTFPDGYMWKFMYSIPIALRNKFLTDAYVPVVNALRNQFYSNGNIQTIRIDQAGSGYTQATITVQGDGYLESDPFYITSYTIADVGSGYTSPTITIEPPFSGVSSFLANTLLILGQRVSHEGNIYEVAISGVTSSVGPVHRYGIAANGTAALKYIGTQATGVLTIVDGEVADLTLLGMLKDISITTGGHGYTYPPVITITGGDGEEATAVATLQNGIVNRIIINDPGINYTSAPTVVVGTPWEASTAVEINDQIFVSNRLYTVTGAGTTGLTAPVHISGEVSNGTAELTYAGQPATATASIKYGAGYSSLPSVTISENTSASIYFTGQKSEAKLVPIITNATMGTEWANSTTYTVGQKVWYDNNMYVVVVAGTSASTPPTHTTGLANNGTSVMQFASAFGQITGVQIDDGGVGYTYVNLNIVGDGDGAEITADLSPGDVNTLQANIELLTVDGRIMNIPVVSGGYGYGSATVTITGDGTGATAEAVVENGALKKINITNYGQGYRWATATIDGAGYGAKARVIISPYGGHGKNAVPNLYGRSLMFYSNISKDKNQGFDVNNDYRQLGLIKSPRKFNSTDNLTSILASACWVVSASNNQLLFPVDSIIYLVAENSPRFRIVTNTGQAMLLQSLDNAIPKIGSTFINDNSDLVSASAVTPPTVDKYSGELVFIDNKQAFTPTADETVTLRTVIKF